MIATQRAPAAYIGPTQYRQMLWGILLGYLTFGDGVDVPMITGMAFIIASGLLPLWQKTRASFSERVQRWFSSRIRKRSNCCPKTKPINLGY